MYKKDTIANNAELEIEEVPFTILCKTCGKTMTRDDFVFICIHCGSQDLKTLTGKELFLQKMELEL
jgi:hydrogenase nickel incorporation protein HypA/HybF